MQMNQALKRLTQRGGAGSDRGTAGEVVVAMDLAGMRGTRNMEADVTSDTANLQKSVTIAGFSQYNEKRRVDGRSIWVSHYGGIGKGELLTPEIAEDALEALGKLCAQPVPKVADADQAFKPLVNKSHRLRKQEREEKETLRKLALAATKGAWRAL